MVNKIIFFLISVHNHKLSAKNLSFFVYLIFFIEPNQTTEIINKNFKFIIEYCENIVVLY